MFRISQIDAKNPGQLQQVREYVGDRFKGGFRAFERDMIFAARSGDGPLVGLACARPVLLLHEFLIAPNPRARVIAHDLATYGLGFARALDYSEALLLIDKDNVPMLQFSRAIQAVEDPGYDNSRLFYLDIR